MTDRRPWLVLAAVTVLWLIVQLQWGHGLHWDEIEFFRASRWIGLGQLPYRDFWEHHTPLQWFAFAPIARWFGNGCGVNAVLAMRWAQLPLWIAMIALLWWWMRWLEVAPILRVAALLILGSSTSFATWAIEYRLDVLGNLLLVGALTLIARQRMWIVAGALLAASVLGNVRLAPLVIIVTIAALFPLWRWNHRALLILVGGAAVSAMFWAFLAATHSIDAATDGLVRYNLLAEELGRTIEHNSLWSILAQPFQEVDVAGIVLLIGGVVAAVMALRTQAQIVAVAAIASLLLQFRMTMHYGYHLQTFELLALPLIALAATRVQRAPAVAFVIVVLSLGAGMAKSIPSYGEQLRYQDQVMCAASALTGPADVVFDGVGYAIDRPPAYRYWFLPAGLQLLAARGLVAPYDIGELLQRPPGAIVYSLRTFTWFTHFPRLGAYVVRHYLPVYRNLWIPGMSARLDPHDPQSRWLVPANGRYHIYAAEELAKHPWFDSPLKYGIYADPGAADLAVSLTAFRSSVPLDWTVDGNPVSAKGGILSLRRGNVLSVTTSQPGAVGLFLVREGVRELFIAPSGSFEF